MTPHVDVVCLSHLRWGFVYQRPDHLAQARMSAVLCEVARAKGENACSTI